MALSCLSFEPGLQARSIFYIEFKFEFEFNIFIFASSSSSPSPVKIYQVFSSPQNKVIDLA